METAVLYYKNVRTGKIYMQVGGQKEPIEIDETFAKMMNLDVNSIKCIDPEEPVEEKKVICPMCGSVVKKTPFCPECGNKL